MNSFGSSVACVVLYFFYTPLLSIERVALISAIAAYFSVADAAAQS